MKFFDAALYSDQRPDADFAHMAWFDVKRVLTLAHAPRGFETAEALWHYLEHVIVGETARLERHGLLAHAAVGVHPEAIPLRAHEEIWQELPWLLRDPRVLALGLLSLHLADAREWEAIARQLHIMAELGLDKPIFFALPVQPDTRARLALLARFTAMVEDHGLAPSNVLILQADWLTLDAIEAAGFWAGLLRSPLHLAPEEVARIAQHHDLRRLVLGSGMAAGPTDILGLPKLAFTLGEAGLAHHDIERLLYGNAMRLLVRGQAESLDP